MSTSLEEACTELAARLAGAETLLTEPDEDGTCGRGKGRSVPPWNSAVAWVVLDVHAGARRLEASIRAEVAGTPGPLRGGSDANTEKALKAIAALGYGLGLDAREVALLLVERWITAARQLPAVDEEERWRRLRGAVCPYCHLEMLMIKPRKGEVTCVRWSACADDNGRHPMAVVEVGVSGPLLRWHDGKIQFPGEMP